MLRRPSARLLAALRFAAVPVAMLASALVVGTASYSAYSTTTVNPTSNWAAGTVALRDDDANSAMFAATNLKPGSTGTKCIAVTNSSSLASSTKLYATGASTTNALSSYIDLTITLGVGGNFGSCTGFTPMSQNSSVFSGTLASFGSTAKSYATGVGSWVENGTTSSDIKTYRITYTLSASAPESTQNGTANISFTWEAQNT